jgi:hypothetical protein
VWDGCVVASWSVDGRGGAAGVARSGVCSASDSHHDGADHVHVDHHHDVDQYDGADHHHDVDQYDGADHDHDDHHHGAAAWRL